MNEWTCVSKWIKKNIEWVEQWLDRGPQKNQP